MFLKLFILILYFYYIILILYIKILFSLQKNVQNNNITFLILIQKVFQNNQENIVFFLYLPFCYLTILFTSFSESLKLNYLHNVHDHINIIK